MTPVNLAKLLQTFHPFFSFSFSVYTDFYDRQKYWGGNRRPCRPCSDAHATVSAFGYNWKNLIFLILIHDGKEIVHS